MCNAVRGSFHSVPSIKGIAVELPFVKLKYVRVDPFPPERSRNTRQVDITVPSGDRPPAAVPRMVVSREAEVTTLGMDGMISFASVIHELTFGRIEAAREHPFTAAYPAACEPSPHSLDIIV